MTYRDDLTAAEARARELERRLESARQDNARLRAMIASRPSPWSRAAKAWIAVGVVMTILGIVYAKEMSRGATARPLGPKVGGAVHVGGRL